MQKVTDFFTKLSGISLALLVMLIVYDALMRYLLSQGSTALQELEWHLFDVVILLSIAFAFKHSAHVRVDILYEKFSPSKQKLIDIITIVFFILPFSGLIIYLGYHFALMSFVQNESSSDPGGLAYRWIVKSLIDVAFLLLFIEATHELKNLLGKKGN